MAQRPKVRPTVRVYRDRSQQHDGIDAGITVGPSAIVVFHLPNGRTLEATLDEGGVEVRSQSRIVVRPHSGNIVLIHEEEIR
jgi:hypothetical protein